MRYVRPLQVLGAIFLLFFIAGTSVAEYYLYRSYKQTQETVLEISRKLEETQTKLNEIASSTTQKLADQGKELSQKTSQIAKLETNLKNTSAVVLSPSAVGNNVLSALSPSVVKVVCYTDRSRQNLKLGSGVLYHSAIGNPAPYFVETNLHVVESVDGSPSACVIALYPNYQNPLHFLVYTTDGFIPYKQGVDFAYIIPHITADSKNAGTMSDLGTFAQKFSAKTYCAGAGIGDHISILGYPGVGGSSLTATDGIISGFEYVDGTRFIKTSAKIDRGNSGGVAVKDSGCILGIPTFVETGSTESIGRILDLNDLFSHS